MYVSNYFFKPSKHSSKLEEHDDFISSLERAERDLSTFANDYQKCLQNQSETGWFYPDNDDF